ncbi:ATP-dependent RNA helicase [Nonomuraea sp. SYSU D8015]|uniref:ATP-dependent RNA helicase n=1 Tax=Nonomuraea sp. SYSU D8015 TaxID=2593644 RepID=UPI0016608D1F|nr:ATP-dependent helicase C-terminal domain-containing protein [Nonomuraea sp. SYSU D8015]
MSFPDTGTLPIRHVLPELLGVIDRHGSAVLTAPPGTGKTTVVPLALAETGMRVLVAEPRRLAVRAAARRMGVSYTIRGERHTGANPMVEVVTTGVLLQRLQRDQELAGVDAVMLDECHERHLDADTALAFLLDVRETLRPDLRLIATSATADAAPWSRLLGGPIVAATGTTHPVETVWAPPPRPVAPPHGLRVDPALLSHVAGVVRRALAEREGDVLCFLPGVGEIAKVAAMLGADGPEILQVHGQAPAHVQDAVLSPGANRRVVLATSVAESSLTVPGVRVVVDSGLAREPRTDHARGLGTLTTVRVSKAAAGQRAGRAGREAPGTVYRCWAAADHERLADHPRPEIALADLTGFALQAACWGDPDASGLALLDAPPAAAMSAATRTLEELGALGEDGRVTARGRRMALAGVHPRLARALLDLGPRAAEVVALLSEQLPREAGDDLVEIWRTARRGGTGFAARWRQEAQRLRRTASQAHEDTRPATSSRPIREPSAPDAPAGRQAPDTITPPVPDMPGDTRAGAKRDASGSPTAAPAAPNKPTAGADVPGRPTADRGVAGRAVADRGVPGRAVGVPGGAGAGPDVPDDVLAGMAVALAFPERVARRRGGGYLMASGTQAQLPDGSRLQSAQWLAIAVADRPTGSASARIRQAVVIDEDVARLAHPTAVEDEVEWRVPPGARRGDVSARTVERLGAIELSSTPLKDADVREAILYGLRTEDLLTWTKQAKELKDRLAFCHRAIGDPWPSMDDLVGLADQWLEPELSRARRRADLERIDVAQALRRLIPWSERLDATAPERIEVPSGSRVRVDYSGEQPVLAVKLQELFGWQETPKIAGVPVLVHLLSPAGRPVAVTADLASFWRDGYRAVRAELRGRYPKHPWPEDPLTATPTNRTRR